MLFAGSFHAYWEVVMHTVSTEVLIESAGKDRVFDEAQLAAAAFLTRYSAQTLNAYRHDLRSFFTGPPCATCNSPHDTPTQEQPRSTIGDARTSTATPPTAPPNWFGQQPTGQGGTRPLQYMGRRRS